MLPPASPHPPVSAIGVERRRVGPPSAQGAARVGTIAAVLLSMLASAALVGWLSGRLVLASVQSHFIPMAPVTGVGFLLVSVAFLLLRVGRAGRLVSAGAGGLVCALALARIVVMLRANVALPDIEAAFVSSPGTFGAVPLARMSPVTAIALAASGLAVVLLAFGRARARAIAGSLGLAVGFTGCTVLLGYAYGTPLLYGGVVIPVALPTGVGLVLAGTVSVAFAGTDVWPLGPVMSHDARGRLLRAFLPATVSAFLVATAGGHVLITRANANPALAAAVSALAAAVIVAAIVWRIADSVGHVIDSGEQHLRRRREDLEAAVASRTAELARTNQELEAFASSVSHDLRAPLRHMVGFAKLLEQTSGATLSAQGRAHLQRISDAGERMTRLIEDLLVFSRTAQAPVRATDVDLAGLATEVMSEIAGHLDGRTIEWHVSPLPVVHADRALLRQVFSNLFSNAVKYTATRPVAKIEIGAHGKENGEHVVFVRDNGVGFDMAYADKLFGVFQRLHRSEEFEGTGIGLANVRRIVQRHGGRTWADGAVDRGATFFFALPG